jgi:signal transduction histidine kinase
MPEIEHLSLADALASTVRAHERISRTDVACRFEALPENVPHFMKVSLCRFAQQCLHNAFQHAGGNSQRLEAWSDGSMVFVCISDAGPGMDVASAGVDGKRLGLYGLVNRIEAWGGRIDIQSAPGRGTQITAAMPIATDKDGSLL